MKKIFVMIAMFSLSSFSILNGAEQKTHLFILSGQSNMVGITYKTSFFPEVKRHFSNDNVIVVKDAKGAQPISRWFKKWKIISGESPENIGDLYDQLMKKVGEATQGKRLDTVTFVWMHGETDTKGNGNAYATCLRGLIAQLENDLDRQDINVVIGRLSDHDMENKKFTHWTMIREIQMKVCANNPRWGWVDTDDLNGPQNSIHYPKEGYEQLGILFAQKSIELIERNSK